MSQTPLKALELNRSDLGPFTTLLEDKTMTDDLIAKISQAMLDYVEEHENDGGGTSSRELNAQTCHLLWALGQVLKKVNLNKTSGVP